MRPLTRSRRKRLMTTPPADSAVAVDDRPVVRAASLPESYRTIAVPVGSGRFWRKLGAFAGPGYLVAVGYMDPGNWATDLAGGSAFGYTLLSVILLSNIMAMVLQALAAKLGIVTGLDLAQACRAHYARRCGWRCGCCANSRSSPATSPK